MADSAASGRDAFLAFELALDERVVDEVRRESWGRAFLTPSTPLVWDSNWVDIERTGLTVTEVAAIADGVLGSAGFAHRTVCISDEADGRRLGEELEAAAADWPGWEVERTRYMEWRGGEAQGPETRSHLTTTVVANCERTGEMVARETTFVEIEGLRRTLLTEEMPSGEDDPEAVVEQLLEIDRRYAENVGDRWFVAPAEGEPASACRLYQASGIAQVEDIGTRRNARERGHAKAMVLAAVAAAQATGAATIFLTADAADWPQLMYAKLGFEEVGDITVMRRKPKGWERDGLYERCRNSRRSGNLHGYFSAYSADHQPCSFLTDGIESKSRRARLSAPRQSAFPHRTTLPPPLYIRDTTARESLYGGTKLSLTRRQ